MGTRVKFKTWLEAVENLEAGFRKPMLIEAAAHTSFQAPLPPELAFLDGRFVDLGFENLGLGPAKFNDLLRAFSGTGVVVPNTTWRLRFAYPSAVVEPTDGSEQETLPYWWKEAVLVTDDQITMKKTKSGSKEGKRGDSPSRLIGARIPAPNDWRGEMLARIRMLIKQADPEVVEEVKWKKPSNPAGVPVWSHDGIICTGETYKKVVKLTFAKGASLKDPSGLFNSSLEGNTRRAIDIHEGDAIDEKALQALIRAAVALNTSTPAAAGRVGSRKRRKSD